MLTVNRKVVDVVNRKQRCTVAVTTFDDTHIEQVVSPSSSTSHSRSMNAEFCKALYSDAHGVFILFDVTDRQSFVDLQHHLLQMAEWGNDDAMVFFLANHSDVDASIGDTAGEAASGPRTSRFGGKVSSTDATTAAAASVSSAKKQRVVTSAEAETFAETYGGFMLEASALTGEGVTTAFEAILYAVTTIIAEPEATEAEDILTESTSGRKELKRIPSVSSELVVRPIALRAKLGKKSKYLQSWNERYFSLEDGILYFQRVEGEGNPRNSLFMSKDTKFNKVGELQLEVVAPTARKDMMLKFPTTGLRDEWMVSLLKHGLFGSSIKQKEKYDAVI